MLNKSKFSNIELEADLAHKRMITVQKKIQEYPSNRALHQEEAEVTQQYFTLNKARMSFLQQIVKSDWLKEGIVIQHISMLV